MRVMTQFAPMSRAHFTPWPTEQDHGWVGTKFNEAYSATSHAAYPFNVRHLVSQRQQLHSEALLLARWIPEEPAARLVASSR